MYHGPSDTNGHAPSPARREDLPFHGKSLVKGSTGRVVTDMQQFFPKPRIEKVAVLDERARLGRELHDGVLQSLAGAAIQLEAIARLIASDPDAAKAQLRVLSEMFGEQQRDLRRWIDDLRSASAAAMAPVGDLATAIERLRQRAAWQHGIRVDADLPKTGNVPRSLGDHVYRIVQEALTNVGKHARAQVARVELRIAFDHLEITIHDDGVGFPFQGTRELEGLQRRNAGPRSIMDRVSSLQGTLTIASSPSGARVKVSLPFSSA